MSSFNSRQSAWGRIVATLPAVKGERGMWEQLYNTRVSRDAQGQVQVAASPAAHTITPRRVSIQGVAPMVCAVCGEVFGVVNADVYLDERGHGVRYYCKAHRGKA